MHLVLFCLVETRCCYYVIQAGLEFVILVSQLPKCWDHTSSSMKGSHILYASVASLWFGCSLQPLPHGGGEELLPTVRFHMAPQGRVVTEGLSAGQTLVGLLTSVDPPVHIEI